MKNKNTTEAERIRQIFGSKAIKSNHEPPQKKETESTVSFESFNPEILLQRIEIELSRKILELTRNKREQEHLKVHDYRNIKFEEIDRFDYVFATRFHTR